MSTADLKRVAKKIRACGNWWIADRTLPHLEALRLAELDLVLGVLPGSGNILEIGAGSGWQAKALAQHGYTVSAIDLASSNYLENRIWPVTDYDGEQIPFADDTFDYVFSSNVLEHIPHVKRFQKEIMRVLKPEGCAIHVLPSGSWSFWTYFTNLLKYWTLPGPHGTHAPTALAEIYYFSRGYWNRLFEDSGWTVDAWHSNGLFYTGNSIMDSRLSIATRKQMARYLGAACHIVILRMAG